MENGKKEQSQDSSQRVSERVNEQCVVLGGCGLGYRVENFELELMLGCRVEDFELELGLGLYINYGVRVSQ